MRLFFLNLVALIFSTISFANNKPEGLLTDLLQYTDIVYINGFASSLPLGNIDEAIEPIQYAEIHSTHPTFSWIVPGKENGTVQTAYHIILSDTLKCIRENKGTVWDSKQVNSKQSVSVIYGGESLKPSTTYYWRVKTLTNTAGESDWSDIKAFRTGKELSTYSAPHEILVKTKGYPEKITSPDNETLFIDFGKAAFGQLQLALTSETGKDTVTVHLGEAIKDGKVDRKPGGTIRYQAYTLPLRKGTHTYRIKIRNKGWTNARPVAIKMPSYIGEVLPFRYAEITGYDKQLRKEDVTREYVTYPFDDYAAHFRCNNDTLNQIWDFCKYSIKATTFCGVYVDGDRERIPYEADAIINQLGHYCTDREYSMARRSTEYLLEHPTWPTEWILQAVMLAWYDYLYTGDTRSLASNYEILQNRTLVQLKEENGLISTTTGKQSKEFQQSIRFNGQIRDIVDWPHQGILGLNDMEGGEIDGFIFTDYNAVTNAYHYHVLTLMQQIAQILGKTEDASYYNKESKRVKDAYNKMFFDATQKVYADGDTTQHASLHTNMFAVDFDLVPDKYISSVMAFIRSRGMLCSVYGSQFLLDALYDGNEAEYALSLLTSTTDRSWYNMMRAGSTISMEAWDNKYKPNQDWNHAWGAAPANVIPRKLIGVEPILPGYERMRIKPQTASLQEAECAIPTIRGEIKVSISNTSDSYTMTVTLPANMSGEVYLPLSDKKKVTCNGKAIKTNRVKGKPFISVGNISSGTYTFMMQ